jgi:hypothetical protein
MSERRAILGRVAEWHPIMTAREVEPGVWVLSDPVGKSYGSIQIRRTTDGPRYRTEYRGELIGWGTTLRDSCMRLHQMMLRSSTPSLPAASPWPDREGRRLAP